MKRRWVGDLQGALGPQISAHFVEDPSWSPLLLCADCCSSKGTLLLCPVTFSGTRAHEVPRQRHLAPLLSLDLNPTYRFWSLSLSLFFFFLCCFRRGCFHFIPFFFSHVFYPQSKQLGGREVLVVPEGFPLIQTNSLWGPRVPQRIFTSSRIMVYKKTNLQNADWFFIILFSFGFLP